MKKYKSLQSTNLKIQNYITILSMIREKVMSRAEIANVVGMSRPAVSSIIKELIDEGLVKEIGHGETSEVGGKRPILLDIDERAGNILSVYYDGAVLQMAICNLKADILVQEQVDLPVTTDEEAILDKISEYLNAFVKAESEARIIACGFVMKGIVNTITSTLQYSVALPEWENVSIGKVLEKQLQIPVFIENDARAQTLDLLKQEQNHYNTFVSVKVDTGIGTGVALDNQLYRGAFEGAVNFAHTTVHDEGPLCICGNYGCWEALASTTALLHKVETVTKEKGLSIQDIILRYNKGEAGIRDIVNNYTAYWIGVGLANIARVFQPEKIVLLSVLNAFQAPFRENVKEIYNRKSSPAFNRSLIAFEEVDDNLQLRSAAEVVCSYFYSADFHEGIWRNNDYSSMKEG
ncbi:ROK family transcriptional regulator [Salibacterium aidingense]|uniref:ROK family transcriptional regulator n=1 Tax=Salibacterium aidingense TaxID=384933 RepID=UPI003BC84C99